MVVSVATAGATIHYSQDGGEPTEGDPTIASGGTINVTFAQTLKAKAFKSAMPPSTTQSAVYNLQVAQPSFSPAGGTTYASAQTVTMTTATPGATIRYTTDTSTPTESSTAYTGPVSVSTTTTLKALGFKSNWTTSLLRSSTYTMGFGTLAAPTADQVTAPTPAR